MRLGDRVVHPLQKDQATRFALLVVMFKACPDAQCHVHNQAIFRGFLALRDALLSYFISGDIRLRDAEWLMACLPALDLQLKATASVNEPRAGVLPFRLSIKNYNDLRIKTQTPRLLVVLDLPGDEVQWMTVTMEKLVLRRRAYWLSLQQGYDDVTGQETVTVHIPNRNLLDVEILRKLMERSRAGEL